MRLFGTYLWKEWRDHRAILVGLVLAVPLLLAVMGLSLPQKAFESLGDRASRGYVGFSGFAALACLALFVISLATDLVPGEARRGHRWFLERLPGGLGAAFRGKLVLFSVGAAFFASYGYLAGAVTCRFVAGEWPPLPPLDTVAWMIAIAVLWIFAVSCALPRGALSLPAVAALALLLALPAILLWLLYPSRGPEAWWRWESGALWTAGAVGAAWAAFRRRGFLRAGRACLCVGALCAMPYWVHAAHDALTWHRVSFVQIRSSYLGEGGRYAFVNRTREGGYWRSSPVPPVIVDLRTGQAREVGGKFKGFYVDWSGCNQLQHRFVLLRGHSRRPSRRDEEHEEGFRVPEARCDFTGGEPTVFDARTAEPAHPTDEDWRAARRAMTAWRLADGRAAWFHAGQLETDAEDGGVKVLLRGQPSPCGLGFEFWAPQRGYYDAARGSFYLYRDLALREGWGADVPRNALLRAWIRPGAWLAHRGGHYWLFDPDANTLAPALGLETKDNVSAVLDDGRIVVARAGEGSLLISPDTGRVARIAVPAGFEGGCLYMMADRTPDGRRVFALYRDGRNDVPPGPYRACFVRQDGDSFTATAPLESWSDILGCPTDDEIIVHDGRAIYRLRFGSDECEEIWRVR
jgi:hypothetical protein